MTVERRSSPFVPLRTHTQREREEKKRKRKGRREKQRKNVCQDPAVQSEEPRNKNTRGPTQKTEKTRQHLRNRRQKENTKQPERGQRRPEQYPFTKREVKSTKAESRKVAYSLPTVCGQWEVENCVSLVLRG